MQTPLVVIQSQTRKPQPQVGDLVTVQLRDAKVSGALLVRLESNNAWVRLNGLSVPAPYKIGDGLVVGTDKVIDW